MNEDDVKKMQDSIAEALKGLDGKFITEEQIKVIVTEQLKSVSETVVTKDQMKTEFEDFARNITKEISDSNTKSNVPVGVFTKEMFDGLVKNLETSKKADITVKAAAAFTTANITSGTHLTSYEVDGTIHAAPREANAVLPALLKGTTAARTIYWANRINEDGGSAFIGEGVLKPLKDWDYTEENSVAKKVAVRTKVSREMLTDFAAFKADMESLIRIDLMEEIEDKLLTATASSTTLTGITTVAASYTTTALDDKVDLANNVDAIRAAMLQQRLLNFKSDVLFLNPTEYALLDLIKDGNGNYIKIQTEGILRSLRVFETTNIPAGYFLLMDSMKWTVKMLEGISLEYGLDSDDFSKNMMSVICEARLHSYYNTIDAGAFIYDDFATVVAQIVKPVV